MPSEEQTYRDGVRKDIQNMQNVLELRMQTFEKDTRDSLSRIEIKGDSIDKKVSYTNGKVRKIIIALVLVFGILIGQNFGSVHDIIQLFSNAL
jgi:hypothetical protein